MPDPPTPIRIPFNRPTVRAGSLADVTDALSRQALDGDGPYTRACEELLGERLDGARVMLTRRARTSCTHALELAALLTGVGPGDEVVMPSYTFVSVANAIVLRGATPVFLDVRPDTFNLDERLLEEALFPPNASDRRGPLRSSPTPGACTRDAAPSSARPGWPSSNWRRATPPSPTRTAPSAQSSMGDLNYGGFEKSFSVAAIASPPRATPRSCPSGRDLDPVALARRLDGMFSFA